MKILPIFVCLLCFPILSYADNINGKNITQKEAQNSKIRPYASLKLGYVDASLKISEPANKDFTKNAFSFNPAVGLKFDTEYFKLLSFRIEAEYMRNTSISNDYSTQRQWRTGTAPYLTYHYETRKNEINTSVNGGLFNAYIDVDLSIIDPYVIMGFGYGKITQENQLIVDTFNDSNVTGADTTEYITYSEKHSKYNMFWQIGLGVSFDITEKWSLNAEYRYINYGSLKLYDLEYKYIANQFLFGAKYRF